MWDINTIWFDLFVVLGIFAVGNILLGHFEDHKPKWRRLLKVAIVIALAILLFQFQLRWVLYLFLSLSGLVAVYIHAIWMPKNGVNGWTGEPRLKYLELMGVKQKERAADVSSKK